MTHSNHRRRDGRLRGRAWWLAVAAVSAGGCSPYVLTVEDRLCPVGEDIKLIGKLEIRGVGVWNKGLDDRELSFYIDDRLVDRDDTNDDGYADVKRRFRRAGTHRLTVVYADPDTGARKATGAARVFVWDEQDPILIVDIDGTISRANPAGLFNAGPDRSTPMPRAPGTLRRLADRFRVVYLTARPRDLLDKTRDWLRHSGFPGGPVLTWDVDRYEWSQADYKKDRIDDIQDDFECVTIGVGNTPKDHDAYRKRKLFTILIAPDDRPQTTERGVRLPDWAAVGALFERNPGLYDPELSYKIRVELPARGQPGRAADR